MVIEVSRPESGRRTAWARRVAGIASAGTVLTVASAWIEFQHRLSQGGDAGGWAVGLGLSLVLASGAAVVCLLVAWVLATVGGGRSAVQRWSAASVVFAVSAQLCAVGALVGAFVLGR
ncbi:MAG: hypothetical protein HOW97_03570 [Catenulispora sp.]|nr:hypothetical protein [Catenulispora sp.]NUR61001.1 hypothetical protein [Catenulispora sp.]